MNPEFLRLKRSVGRPQLKARSVLCENLLGNIRQIGINFFTFLSLIGVRYKYK